MQTPKARANYLEVPQKKSPIATRAPKQLKIWGSDSGAMVSTPKSVSKNKHPDRIPELECQLSQLQEDLKKAKDQLASSESGKQQALKEAEEAKHRLSLLSQKLEDSQQQLRDVSASEEGRVQELRKVSQDRDRAWQSELKAVHKQQFMDSAALTLAMNEVEKLRAQLEKLTESEAAQSKHAESAHHKIQRLRFELCEALSLVEKLRGELNDCRESEAQALEVVRNMERQLEIVSTTVETLRSECVKVSKNYDSAVMELGRTNDRVKELETQVDKLQEEPMNGTNLQAEEINQLKDELNSAKNEAGHLRSALNAAEMRYQEEYIQSTLQIRSAYEQVESAKKESLQRKASLEEELKKAMSHFEELGRNSVGKSGTKSDIKEESDVENDHAVASEFERLQANLFELKAALSDRETKLRSVSGENEALKMELSKREEKSTEANNEALALREAMKESEQEALRRAGSLSKEADESKRRVERAMEQLDAAQAANLKIEAELRRMKVQADQWRKAAEAAAGMISGGGGNNGKPMKRPGSLGSYVGTVGGNVMGSPCPEDMEKKRNISVLMKKMAVLRRRDRGGQD